MESKVVAILKELGMPMGNLGFSYAKEALLIVLQGETNLQSITAPNGVYGIIAKKNNTTTSRVERAMRHAIESIFLHCNSEILYKYFGNTPDLKSGKLTNKNFIATLVQELKISESTVADKVALQEPSSNTDSLLSTYTDRELIVELLERFKGQVS